MALMGDQNPLSKSNVPGKHLHDDNGRSRGFSTNFKRCKIVPPPPIVSRYSEPLPGFHETGFMKVQSERTGLPLNPSRKEDKTDFTMETENGTLYKQSDTVVSPKTSPRSPTFASKVRPTKIQMCDPVPQFTRTRVSKVKTSRTHVPVNRPMISIHNDSCEKVTLHDPVASKYSIPKMQSLVPVARDLPSGCGQRFRDELDEDGCASRRISERVPLKELAKAHSFDAKATKGGNFVPAKDLSSLSKFRDGEKAISRYRVIKTLGLFDKEYEEAHEAKLKGQGKACEHISTIATRKVKEKINWVNNDRIGVVPGIEIGDQFRFKGQLVLIGLHHQYSDGISYIKEGEKCYATSIVDSDRYTSKIATDPDTIFFSGQGGNPLVSHQKKIEDQKLERGNLALKNSMDAKIPVRVIRKLQVRRASKKEVVFVYDGLYTISKCSQERGQFKKLIFMFELKRKAGQPRLENCIMSEPKTLKGRNGVCLVEDISQGKEKIPIHAFNALDHEKPPRFKYITEMYPNSFSTHTTKFCCKCASGCLESDGCSCVVKNGGKILFNENGTLVDFKPTVYLCGPSCKCPLSCRNRISETGLRYQLEIFKIEYNTWGVRSQNFISKGSFICEYVGVLRQSREANKGSDHKKYVYAFRNETLRSRYKKGTSDDDGYVIDATECGNVARFINHSRSPNLYAQTVVYDRDGKKVPHVMLFALKNITPCRELTLGYNCKD